MKFTTLSLVAFTAHQVAGHATFQALWVNGTSCLRIPQSNSPVTNVLSNDIRCNANNGAAALKCAVPAGGTVTVEMHQQPGDRTCAQEAIGGQHYGPVMVYMSKVSDALTADGSAGWFKIFQNGWSKTPGTTRGADDYWGVKDLNLCCGRMNIKIPTDIPNGDYLLRSEVIALHSAQSTGGAQFYISCFQITVTGSTGTGVPSLVNLPGAYAATDPGIKFDIYPVLNTYVVPGPTVWVGGVTRTPGSGTCSGVESGTTTGPALTTPTATTTSSRTSTTLSTLVTTTSRSSSTSSSVVTTASRTSSRSVTTSPTTTTRSTTTSAAPVTTTTGGSTGCSVAKYGQCGGSGFTGCTTCAAGAVCSAVSPPFYSQCL